MILRLLQIKSIGCQYHVIIAFGEFGPSSSVLQCIPSQNIFPVGFRSVTVAVLLLVVFSTTTTNTDAGGASTM
eukprot:scaffold1468_cov206-Alexandrium_tamarense.AAC.8